MRTSAIDPDLVGYGGGPSGAPPGRSAQQIFVAVLLVVIGMIFMLTTIAYLGRSKYPDWRALADSAEPLSHPWRLWLNTVLLALGGAALHGARRAQALERQQAVRVALAAAGVFGIAFLAGQLTVWDELVAGGHLVARNPANSFFYLITGLHGAHLAVGLAVLALVGARAWRHRGPGGQALQLLGWYWDFLFVLWLAMFALLASSGETLDAFAALCGMR